MAKKQKERKTDQLLPKPPVVVILGHVDHGKTSILDYIRKSKVAAKESGGITQHIGAYQIEHNGKPITFIDTPGHEAFSAMRSRGARVADVAVLVVAAEEGIKPQTKEAIAHIKKCGVPTIVAINKIDKKEAQPEKVKAALIEQGINVESLGGDTPSVNVSAKTGQGIDELLEIITLVSDMEELSYDPQATASGVVIESNHDARRGPTATLLVKQGIIAKQSIIGTDSAVGHIKSMEDFRAQPITAAPSSTPVVITGLDKVPQVGEKFYCFATLDEARSRVQKKNAKRETEGPTEILVIEPGKKVLNIILKADVQGSLEAIKECLKAIPAEEATLRIVKAEAGEITQSDIDLAQSAQARVIGFRTKTGAAVKRIAEQRKIKIYSFDIIYELIQKTREMLSRLLEPEIVKNVVGQLKVLALFKKENDRQVIGGKITNGQARQGLSFDIFRPGKSGTEKIGQGRIVQLQRDKKEIEEANKGQECGIMFKGAIGVIQAGDLIEFFEEEKKKREI